LRRRRPIPAEEVFGAERQADEAELHRAGSLRAALISLPDEQRTVVVMRHLVGLTPAEIATRMGRTESSVHGLHHRGRRALQQELRRLDSAPSIATAAV
jgi:RNA polymerase sigma-70 factor (ECF subfamily)